MLLSVHLDVSPKVAHQLLAGRAAVLQGLYKREEEKSGASLGVFLTAQDDYNQKEKKNQHVLAVDVGAHGEAILGLRVISHPAAVLSCGLDKRVRLWALPTLATCGGLLQRRDQQFQFELGQNGRTAAIDEARRVPSTSGTSGHLS